MTVGLVARVEPDLGVGRGGDDCGSDSVGDRGGCGAGRGSIRHETPLRGTRNPRPRSSWVVRSRVAGSVMGEPRRGVSPGPGEGVRRTGGYGRDEPGVRKVWYERTSTSPLVRRVWRGSKETGLYVRVGGLPVGASRSGQKWRLSGLGSYRLSQRSPRGLDLDPVGRYAEGRPLDEWGLEPT